MGLLVRGMRAAVAATGLLLAACGGGSGEGGSAPPPPPANPPATRADAFRFLNQSTFGATEATSSQLVALGDASTAYPR